MANDDAALLLEENFIAGESDPFDCMGDDNDPYTAEPKYKKNNFTSLWRKPKIGRRKTRSIGKRRDSYDKPFDSSSLKTRGRYVKDRESFDTNVSVPLSDFDEAKDTLPFLHFRPGNSYTRTSVKEKTALNPKMFLSQAPSKRRESKSQTKKDKNDEDEWRDIFKPIHNNSNTFDAFQILPKESPSKVKSEDETPKKQKDEESDDIRDKENFFQDSIYCDNLYQDHGPILSSLSEDTLNSDSVRGEQFLEENFNGNEPDVYPSNKWKAFDDNVQGREDNALSFRDGSNQNEVQRLETIPSADASSTIETNVRSFSDRLKLFQSKATQPAEKSRYDSSMSNYSSLSNNLNNPKTTDDEAVNDLESTMVPETPELENTVSDVEKCETATECDMPKVDEKVLNQVQVSNSPELKTSNTTHSHSIDRNMNPTRFERNYFAKLQKTTGSKATKSSGQPNAREDINDANRLSLSKKIPVKSKVVDLSLIESYKNRALDKNHEKKASRTNSVESTLSVAEEKEDPTEIGNQSRSSCVRNLRRLRSFSNSYRSSSISLETTSKFGARNLARHDTKSIGLSSESTPGIDEVTKTDTSKDVVHPLEINSSNDLKDTTTLVAKQASEESELNKHEIKNEKPRDSFRTATYRFGRKLEQSESKLGRKLSTTIQREENKEMSEKEDDGKEKVNHSGTHSTKKSFESWKSKVDISGKTAPFSNEVKRRSTIQSSDTKLKDEDTVPLESENKTHPKHQASNDITTNTSISSLTCDSAQPSSFAQQSASMFGVTLSKTRKKRIDTDSTKKEDVKPVESCIAPGVCSGRLQCQNDLDDSQMTRAKSNVVEESLSENKTNDKQNVICEEYRQRKVSASSISLYSVDKKMGNGIARPKKEEGPSTAKHSFSNGKIGSSCQQVKLNENDGEELLASATQTDVSDSKAEPVASARRATAPSFSDRRKMFEQATTRNQIVFSSESDDCQDTARTGTPKSVDSSESPFDDTSISTKRRSTESEIKIVDLGLHRQPRQSLNSHDTNYSNCDDIIGDRRKTLKSNRGTMLTSGPFQRYGAPSHDLDQSVVSPKNPKDDENDAGVDNGITTVEKESKALRSSKSEVEKSEKSSKEPSPRKTSYSARRKFFENLDRKRVQAAMSRPLFKQNEPFSNNTNPYREHEIEFLKDDTLRDVNGLPMFVTVDEDFMLKDNISTCLSASEQRSVICKPDTLLYSVSQKAIALMSAKAENNSIVSVSKTARDGEKETIHNDSNRKQFLAQGMKSNREESNADNTATRYQLRSRFERKKATNGDEGIVHGPSDDDKESNNKMTKESLHRPKYNGFVRKMADSEMRQELKRQQLGSEEVMVAHDDSVDVGDKSRPSVNSIGKLRNRFVRKNLVSQTPTETESKDFRKQEQDNDNDAQNLDDRVRGLKEDSESVKEDKEMQAKPNNVEVEPVSQQIGSMSIKARRKFFESQLGKKSAVSTSNLCSSSNDEAKIRASEASDITPLVGENISEQNESVARNKDSESSSYYQKRISSTSIGTLDYSLTSSSNVRPSDLGKRISSASAPVYRKGFSSKAIRSTSVGQGKKNPDLRCF